LKASSFSLDSANALPVYAQLRNQVLHAIARGSLKPNDQLPTVREVAVHLQINPNTVNRAYMELEREGVLVTARSRGTFVSDGVRRSDPELRRARIEEIARTAVAEARTAGFTPPELVKAITASTRRGK
jgi:GntR family transcriptional regulator